MTGLGDWTQRAKAVSDARPDVVVYPEIGMDSTTTRLAALRLAPMLVFFRAQPEPVSVLFETRLRQSFEAAGPAFDDAVRFIPWQSPAAFFGLLDRADVFLDSAGFSGFNTAMQAFERRAPIVAWDGDFMRGSLRERHPARSGPG